MKKHLAAIAGTFKPHHSTKKANDLNIVIIGDLTNGDAEYRKSVLLKNLIYQDATNSPFSDGSYNFPIRTHNQVVNLTLKDVSNHTSPPILRSLCEGANILIIPYVDFNEDYVTTLLNSIKEVLQENPTIILVGLGQQEDFLRNGEIASISHQTEAAEFARKKGWIHQVVTLNDIPSVKGLFHTSIDTHFTNHHVDVDIKTDILDTVDLGIQPSKIPRL